MAKNTEEKEKKTADKVEKLEKKAVPGGKKTPVPAPYAPGTLYGLIKRENLLR